MRNIGVGDGMIAGDVLVDEVADDDVVNNVDDVGNNNELEAVASPSAGFGRRNEPRLFANPPAAINAAADDGVVGPLPDAISVLINAFVLRLVNEPRCGIGGGRAFVDNGGSNGTLEAGPPLGEPNMAPMDGERM